MKHLKHINEAGNSPFKFKKSGTPKIDKLYLKIMFAGGDADTEHPETIDLKIKFSEYENHLDEINKIIENYIILRGALDINSVAYCKKGYKEVKIRFGEEIADLFDNTPNDPQNDYQNKCYLDSMELIGYDQSGHKHKADIDIYKRNSK
jgi:hypothetical protein